MSQSRDGLRMLFSKLAKLDYKWTLWYYVFFLLVTLTTLGLTIYSGVTILRYPDDGLIWTIPSGHIDVVEKGGPASLAGVRESDRVLGVNGTPVRKIRILYHHKKPGDTVYFTLLRQGDRMSVPIRLVAPSLYKRIRFVESLLIALAFWLSSSIIWILRPFHKVPRLFFTVGQTTTALLAVGGLSGVNKLWASPSFGVLLILIAPLTLHFYAQFPDVLSNPPRCLLLRIAYGTACVLVALDLAIALLTPQPIPRPFVLLRGTYVSITLSAALVLAFRPRRLAPLEVRQRHRLLIAGMAGSLLPLIILSLVPQTIWGTPWVDYVWTFPFLIFLPISFAYAVGAGDLGRVDWVLNRTLVHLLLTGILTGLYVGLFLSLNQVLMTEGWSKPIIAAALAVGVAVTFAPLRDRLQRWVDRLFYGGWYDYKSMVNEARETLSSASEPELLIRGLLDRITAAMKLRYTGILLPAYGEAGKFAFHTPSSDACPMPTKPISRKDPLIEALTRIGKPVENGVLKQHLNGQPLADSERSLLNCPHVRLWIPVLRQERSNGSNGQSLLGALIVGTRLGGDAVDSRDHAILETLAWQVALTMENIGLMGQLRRRTQEMERLYRELMSLREEERKRVARELHDSVVQQLFVAYRTLGNRQYYDDLEKKESKVRETEELLLSLMNEVRRISADLRPAVLDVLGLADAIRSYAQVFSEQSGLAIEVTVSGDDQTMLPEAVGMSLFRTFQEALWNVEKHAQASRVDVILKMPEAESKSETTGEACQGEVVLIVRDDGRGFQVPSQWGVLLDRNCYGLVGLRERLSMVGGHLVVRSQPGRGTELIAEVPLR